MKIFFIGVFGTKGSTNISQKEAFEELGHQVVTYEYRLMGAYAIPYMASLEHPDLVLFSKCNGVPYDIINACNKFSKTCLWYMDPSHGFDKELIDKIERVSFSCFALNKPYEMAKELANNVFFVHEGFDSKRIYPVPSTKKHDISFIGTLYGHRQEYFNAKNFHIYSNVFDEAHNKAVAETKINLNFTNNEGSSDRIYKILAAKGFVLTEPWRGIEPTFAVGRDLDVFSNTDQLNYKIELYLRNEGLRNSMAEQGYLTVQQFTRLNWARKIIELSEIV